MLNESRILNYYLLLFNYLFEYQLLSKNFVAFLEYRKIDIWLGKIDLESR